MKIGFCFTTPSPERKKVKAMKAALRADGHQLRFISPGEFDGAKHDYDALFLDFSHPNAERIEETYKKGVKGSPGIPVIDLHGLSASEALAELTNAKAAPKKAAAKEDK